MNNTQWETLLRVAYSLIDQSGIGRNWSFGGGTALMIQIEHRLSHDVDIFRNDPQYLGYLNPAKRDFDFEYAPTNYEGDGSRFQKLVFAGIGEIDFIVSQDITNDPSRLAHLEGRDIALETVTEIIAKKIYYRGSYITPRDVFDIAAACQTHRAAITEALRDIKPRVVKTIEVINSDKTEFVQGVIRNLQIKPNFQSLAPQAKVICMDLLKDVLKS